MLTQKLLKTRLCCSWAEVISTKALLVDRYEIVYPYLKWVSTFPFCVLRGRFSPDLTMNNKAEIFFETKILTICNLPNAHPLSNFVCLFALFFVLFCFCFLFLFFCGVRFAIVFQFLCCVYCSVSCVQCCLCL